MWVQNLPLTLLVLLCVSNVIANSEEEYVDSVINLLLNGESFEVVQSEENDEGINYEGEKPVLIGGIWKCGNCAGVDDSMLVYSEDNDVDVEPDDQPVDVQISLSIPSMRCVAVIGERAGRVRRVGGACAGARVTLAVAAAGRFTVHVYASKHS